MNRRLFCTRFLVVSGSLFVAPARLLAAAWEGQSLTPIVKSAAEWRAILSPAAYRILREEGTEPAFSSPLDREKRAGVYHCAGCDLALFTSEMKFDSGTGWPSFTRTIPGRVGRKTDFKLIFPRQEYHCIRCGGHQGHVFDDGPPPTGKRWCNNGLALAFKAEDRPAR